MVALNRFAALLLPILPLAGCAQDLRGLEDTPAPLAQVQVRVLGDLAAVRGQDPLGREPRLRVALVWGQQAAAESFCTLRLVAPAAAGLGIPLDPSAVAVAEAGCRDPLGFVPQLVGADAAVATDGTATVELHVLPTAEVMVGELSARVAYGSLVAYDDRNGNGVLDLRRPRFDENQGGPEHGGPGPGHGPPGSEDEGPEPPDVDYVYGASFVSMTLPDRRLTFREGGWNEVSAFYPRPGCPPPPVGFSVVGAGGISAEAYAQAIVDAVSGAFGGAGTALLQLPDEPTGTCTTASLDATVIEVPLQATATVRDVACEVRGTDGDTRYREPPEDPLDLGQPWVCQAAGQGLLGSLLGGLGGGGGRGDGKPGEKPAKPAQQELVIAGAPGECKVLRHYVLRGCNSDPACAKPQWDLGAHPPAWWPCPLPAGGQP